MSLKPFALITVVALGFGSAATAQTPVIGQGMSLKPGDSTGIGYGSVAEALQALEAREDTRISKEYGWTIIQDREAGAVWSFTPESHEAHPTMVKRTLIDRGRAVEILMDGQCEASRQACEKVMAELKRRTFRYQSVLAGHGSRMGGASMADMPALQGLLQMSRSIK